MHVYKLVTYAVRNRHRRCPLAVIRWNMGQFGFISGCPLFKGHNKQTWFCQTVLWGRKRRAWACHKNHFIPTHAWWTYVWNQQTHSEPSE